MKQQIVNIHTYGVVALKKSEELRVSGGGTDFAYDVGTALRLSFFSITGNVSRFSATVVNWFIQTNK